MLKSTNILPETNYIPSGERWEYIQISSFTQEDEITFLNRVGAVGWEAIKIKYEGRPVEKMILKDYYIGIFKRKLIANK